jgi:hypothetical protein
MKELNELQLEPLNQQDLNDTEGGIIALVFSGIGLCIAAAGAGYMTGKAMF